MPSGAKKRKAAKKKKEQEATTNPNYPSQAAHGDDELKHHDGKESDDGESSSPVSQDHHHQQHSFSEAEDEKPERREGSSSIQISVDENKITGVVNGSDQNSREVVIEESGKIEIGRERKPEDYSESKDVRIDYVKSADKSRVESSSSSSSDDKSNDMDINRMVVKTTASANNHGDLVSEASAQASTIFPREEITKPAVETVSTSDLDDMSILKEVVHVSESDSVDISAVPGVFGSGLKEHREKVSSSDENRVVLFTEMDENKEEVVSSTSVDNDIACSDSKNSVAGVTDDKLMLSSNAAVVAECMKDTNTHESSKNQPLVAPASRPAQSTWWKSCCGLLEVFNSRNT